MYKKEGRIDKKKKRAPRKRKIECAKNDDVIIDIENLPRTLPIPKQILSVISQEKNIWDNIFTAKFS